MKVPLQLAYIYSWRGRLWKRTSRLAPARRCARRMPFDRKASMEEPMTTEPANRAASLAALLPLVRYGRRYLGRAIAALAALTVSSAATLAVPFALRSMIDFGFSKESGGAINVYFLAMGAVVVVIALAAAIRYYLVTTLGERVVADLRRDVFAHLVGSRRRVLRQRANRRTGVAPHRRHDADQGGVRLLGVDRAAQSLHVRRRDRAHGLYEPQAVGSGARRHSGHRRAAHRLRAGGAPALAARSGHARRSDRLRFREPRRGAHDAGVRRRRREPGAFRRRSRKRLWRRARRRGHPLASDRGRGVARLLQRGVRALARRARRAGGAHERRAPVAVRAVRRARRDLARRIVAGVERSRRRRGFGGADRRTACGQAAHRRAGEARPDAVARPRRDRILACRLRLSGRAGRAGHRRPQLLDRAGRTGRDRRRLGSRQVDRVPAHHALLRLRRGRRSSIDGRRRQDGRSEGPARAHRPGAAGSLDLRRDGRREHRLWAGRGQRGRDRGGGAARGGGRVHPRARPWAMRPSSASAA